MTKGEKNFSLSAQHLISCNSKWQKGCHGGYVDRAWWYLRKKGYAIYWTSVLCMRQRGWWRTAKYITSLRCYWLSLQYWWTIRSLKRFVEKMSRSPFQCVVKELGKRNLCVGRPAFSGGFAGIPPVRLLRSIPSNWSKCAVYRKL